MESGILLRIPRVLRDDIRGKKPAYFAACFLATHTLYPTYLSA